MDRRKFAFTKRSVTVWNTLTEHVISAPNVNVFKIRLTYYGAKNP